MTAPANDSPVELRPREDGSQGLYVGGLFVANLRNPKTIAAWVKRFEGAANPIEAAREHRRRVREQQEYRSWIGRVKKAVGGAFPGVRWETSSTGSHYAWLGRECLVRLSNHPPREGWEGLTIHDLRPDGRVVNRMILAARNKNNQGGTCADV